MKLIPTHLQNFFKTFIKKLQNILKSLEIV